MREQLKLERLQFDDFQLVGNALGDLQRGGSCWRWRVQYVHLTGRPLVVEVIDQSSVAVQRLGAYPSMRRQQTIIGKIRDEFAQARQGTASWTAI